MESLKANQFKIEKHEMQQFFELENEIALLKEKYFELHVNAENAMDKVRQLTSQKIQYIQKIRDKYKIEGKNFQLDFENDTLTAS